jgi:hypothetical protein
MSSHSDEEIRNLYDSLIEAGSPSINGIRLEPGTYPLGNATSWSTNMTRHQKKRIGSLDISIELLKTVLGLPDDAALIGAYIKTNGDLSINVQHPNLPEVDEGAYIPKISKDMLEGFDA